MTAIATAPTATTDGEHFRPTRIEVALTAGRARITALAHGDLIAARPLQITGNHVRIALIGINMALLAGDVVALRVRVGTGVILEVVEPTGLVAYNAEGRCSTWHLCAAVDSGATLIWQGAPFVAAQGSNAHRITQLELARGARILMKETLVLGRSAESGVCLRSQTDVSLNGQALLVEDLDLNKETIVLPGIVAPSRVVSTVMAAGWRPQGDKANPHRLDLSGLGALFRTLEPAMHYADEAIQPWFDDWRREILLRSSDWHVS